MKVLIKEQDSHAIRLWVPTRLMTNSLAVRLVQKALRKKEIMLSEPLLRKFARAVCECRKQYPGLKLVEVQGSDGELVEVTL